MLQDIYSNVIGSNGPLWSLSYEWWYYMIFICVISIIISRTYSCSVIVHVVSLAIGIYVLPRSIICLFVIWLIGLMLSFFLKYNIRINPLCAICIFVLCLFMSRITHNHVEQMWSKYIIDCTVAAGCFLFYASINNVERVATLFPKLNSYLANFSYTVYLVHCPFLVFAVGFINDICGIHFYQQPTGLQLCLFSMCDRSNILLRISIFIANGKTY